MMTTTSAQAGESGENLEQVQQRFAQWREGRQRGARIPKVLWDAALGMVEQHGAQRTAQALGLDRGRLTRRLQRGSAPASADPMTPQFVELFAPQVPTAQPPFACLVEMDNARGGKMRVELNNVAALASLADAFWSAG